MLLVEQLQIDMWRKLTKANERKKNEVRGRILYEKKKAKNIFHSQSKKKCHNMATKEQRASGEVV